MTLAKLRTGAHNRVVGQLVGVPVGSVSAFFHDGLSLIADVLLADGHFATTLTLEDIKRARRTFPRSALQGRESYRIPNTIGALDGWVTGFEKHGGEREEYFNYKIKSTGLNHIILWDGALRPRCLWAAVGYPGRR